MPLLVRAFPLQRPLPEAQAFVAELTGSRREEATAFYKSYGVTHESWHLQDTPNGPWVISVTMIEDPAGAATVYAASNAAFDAWFKDQVRECTGIDPNVTPNGPPTSILFSWCDPDCKPLV